jgi:uncharacterized membrane protein YwzB
VTGLLAHAIGGVRDLPIPLWLFYYGGAVVLVLSFVALGVLWRRPRLEGAHEGRPLPPALQRFLLSTGLRVVVGGASLALLIILFLASLVGEPSAGQNLAPTFVFVIFWVGLVIVVVVVGNVWPLLNPWRAGADLAAWFWREAGWSWSASVAYPERLGRWPAAVLLFAFTALELAYVEPANPRALALAIFLYSWVTWVGMGVFGRELWLRNGEAFNVYFDLLGRIALFGRRQSDGQLVVRPPLSGLTVRDFRPGTLAFVAVMLGSVAFDGYSRTSRWLEWRFELEEPYVLDNPGLGDLIVSAFNFAGLVAFVLLVAIAFLAAIQAAKLVAKTTAPLATAFLGSLVPIALAYALAHYFSLLLIQGQVGITLASDPFGFGWDLFGTADFQADATVISPNTTWYFQVAVLVTGHVAGLMLAHDRAVTLFNSPRTAIRTQYAMLALMVLYTVGGLWLLSRG